MLDVRLPDFSFAISMYVWFRDLDAMGHVNNAVYFSYFEQARTRYWLSLVSGSGSTMWPPNPLVPGGSTPLENDISKIGFIVVHAACDFHSPARFGEALLVGCKISELRQKSFVMDYRIVTGEKLGSDTATRLVATGRTIQALYSWETQQTLPISEEFRKKVESREGSVKTLARHA